MTRAHSDPDDNNGLCESCNDPKTLYVAQETYPVLLGGGLGWGTMWLCAPCRRRHAERDAQVALVPPIQGGLQVRVERSVPVGTAADIVRWPSPPGALIQATTMHAELSASMCQHDDTNAPPVGCLHCFVEKVQPALDEARAEAAVIREAMGMATAYPMTSVLQHLIDAVAHLFEKHDCDADGWEVRQSALVHARTILGRLTAALAPTASQALLERLRLAEVAAAMGEGHSLCVAERCVWSGRDESIPCPVGRWRDARAKTGTRP